MMSFVICQEMHIIFKKVLQSKASRTFWMIFTDGIIFGANFTLYLVYFATLCYTKLVQFYLPPDSFP